MRKAFVYRIYPNKKQIQRLSTWLELLRKQYNWRLAQRRNAWKNEGRSLSFAEQCRELQETKRLFPEYKDIPSHVLQDCLRRLDRAFQAFFRRIKAGENPGYPRFKGRGRYDSLTCPDPYPYIIRGDLNFPKIGIIKMRVHRPIPEGFTMMKQESAGL